jgi:hypothetical protein
MTLQVLPLPAHSSTSGLGYQITGAVRPSYTTGCPKCFETFALAERSHEHGGVVYLNPNHPENQSLPQA